MKLVKNLPEPVQWLLDFANLGCIPGEPNPQRFKSYHTDTFQEYITNEHIPKLKRPPIELLSPEKKKSKNTPCENTIFRLPLHEQIKRLRPGKIPYLITDDGYVVSKAETGEPVFHGKNKDYPSIKEFKDFISKERIPLNKKRDYGFLITCWYSTQSVFYRVIQGNDKEVLHPYVKELSDYAIENKTAHKLSQWVFKYVRDFWNNQRALHSRLRQCRCCGKFWLIENTKIKPRVYCSDKCNKAFHKQAREKNSKSSSASKKARRDRKKKNDYNTIKEFYIGTGYSKENAENHAEKWVYVESKTLESFKKEQGKR
jgi:hypothetical protein